MTNQQLDKLFAQDCGWAETAFLDIGQLPMTCILHGVKHTFLVCPKTDLPLDTCETVLKALAVAADVKVVSLALEVWMVRNDAAWETERLGIKVSQSDRRTEALGLTMTWRDHDNSVQHRGYIREILRNASGHPSGFGPNELSPAAELQGGTLTLVPPFQPDLALRRIAKDLWLAYMTEHPDDLRVAVMS